MADFRNHASAGDGLLNHLWNPLTAGHHAAWALNANLLAAAGIAWVANALFNDWAWDAVRFRDPFAAANVHSLAFRHWLADGVAHVFVAGFCFCLPAGAADVFVASLIDRLADVVAHSAVAGLVDRLTDSVAAVTVAGLVAGLANAAGDVTVAGLVNRLADVVRAGLVAGLVDRLANGVALVAVAGLVDVLHARDRNRFRALIVNSLHAGVLLGFPDYFLLHGATLRICPAASGYKVTTR